MGASGNKMFDYLDGLKKAGIVSEEYLPRVAKEFHLSDQEANNVLINWSMTQSE